MNNAQNNTEVRNVAELRELFKKYFQIDAPEALTQEQLAPMIERFEAQKRSTSSNSAKIDSLRDIMSEKLVSLRDYCEKKGVDAEKLYKLFSVNKLSVRVHGDFLKENSGVNVDDKTIEALGINENFENALQFYIERFNFFVSQLIEMGIITADDAQKVSNVDLSSVPTRGYVFKAEQSEASAPEATNEANEASETSAPKKAAKK